MKQHVQGAGVRDWYGDDAIEIQNEILDPLQAFFKNFGPCIVQGCVITPNSSNWDIAAGIVAINHADGFKLARFAGVTNVSLASGGYLSIAKTTVNGNYGTGSAPIAYNYTATFTAGAAPVGDQTLYLKLYAPGVNVVQNTFHQAVNTSSWVSSATLTSTTPDTSASMVIKVNKASRIARIKGAVSIVDISNFQSPPAIITQLLLLPISTILADTNVREIASPASTVRFTAYVTSNLGTYLGVPSQINCWFDPAVGIVAELQEAGALYDFDIDCLIHLD